MYLGITQEVPEDDAPKHVRVFFRNN